MTSSLTPEELAAYLAGPGLTPPNGTTSNFDNPPNQNGLAVAVITVCVTVATLFLFARAWLKVVCLKQVEIGDLLVLVGYGNFIGFAYSAGKLMESPGYFVHQWDVRLGALINIGYVVHIASIVYSVSLACIKVAILLEWIHILVPQGTRNGFWWTCIGVMTVQLLFMVAAVVALCLVCTPYEANWNFLLPRKCFTKSNLEFASASLHLVTDIIILALPQKVIWSLRLSIKKRLGVAVVFSLGLLGVVSAAFRLSVNVTYAEDPDTTYAVGPVAFWALAEMTCGIVVVCAPLMPKFFVETGIATVFTATTRKVSGMGSSNNKMTADGSISTTGIKSAPRNYHKMHEPDVPLASMRRSTKSESTEHLQDDVDENGKSILRTTRVTVVRDNNTDEERFDRVVPWPAR